jgi:hypothetical protein
MARENPNSGEPPRSAMASRRERELGPPLAGASHPNRLIGDERLGLEAEIPLHGDRSWTQITEATVHV